MAKARSVVNFYILCNKLKNLIRTGWKDWHVEGRLESVADHIYGTQMLAIAMVDAYSKEFKNIDLKKVIMMLAIHELGEIKIGDLTQFQISKQEKHKLEMQAVDDVLSTLVSPQQIKELYLEFENRETEEAWFAHFCDKLECDLQSKIYDEYGRVDLNNQDGNRTMQNERVQRLLQDCKDCSYQWSSMWLKFGQEVYGYPKPFIDVSNYALKHKITKKVNN